MKVIINYNGKNIHRSEGMFFKPGNNEIELEAWNAGQRNPLLLKKVEQGLLRVVSVPPGYDKAGNLTDEKKAKEHQAFVQAQQGQGGEQAGASLEYPIGDMDISDAEDVIKSTYDLKLLGSWQGQETRKKVKNAIADRIEFLNKKNQDLVDKK